MKETDRQRERERDRQTERQTDRTSNKRIFLGENGPHMKKAQQIEEEEEVAYDLVDTVRTPNIHIYTLEF